jgi:hypothetical protein
METVVRYDTSQHAPVTTVRPVDAHGYALLQRIVERCVIVIAEALYVE